MAPEKAPAFQFYPKDYLTDPRVRAMSFEQRGLYWEAVSICWLEGSLPADQGELAAILGCPLRRLSIVWPRISQCFETHGDRLTHKRLDKERAAQAESRERRTEAARKRWEKDAMHMQSTASEQSSVDTMQCSPSSSASSSASSTSSATPVNSARPLVSGEANPRTWGKIHGDHVTGFCDWVCLPEFLFNEFARKSAGPEYVMGWARRVRERFLGQDIGDNLKFWRAQWDESHPAKAAGQKPINIQEILDKEAARKAGKAS